MEFEYQICPKCGYLSGDDWSQCEGSCPQQGSPHFNEMALMAYGHAVPLKSERGQQIQKKFERKPEVETDDIPF